MFLHLKKNCISSYTFSEHLKMKMYKIMQIITHKYVHYVWNKN
jgi:hypothetical protein